MKFDNLRVLVTDGDARQTMTILHELKQLGCNITVTCNSKWDLCYASKVPDKKILYKGINRDDEYDDFLLKLIKTGEYDVILPVDDVSTNSITKNETEVKRYVRIACAPRRAYMNTFNKQITFEAAIQSAIPCPYTRKDNQDLEEFLSNTSFPIIIKPRQGMGSIGFRKFDSETEFREFLNTKEFNPNDYIVQECIDFDKRVDAFIFIDQNGVIKTSMAVEVLRWYPIDAGTSTFTRTVKNNDVIKYGGEILRALDYRGFADVSFMLDNRDHTPKLMEINGRIPAGIKLSWYCGYNVARQLIEMSFDEEVVQYNDNEKYDMMARHSQADFMWFLKSKDRFRANPSWFSNKNTTDLVRFKGDLKPALVYTLNGIFQYRKFMKKRKR